MAPANSSRKTPARSESDLRTEKCRRCPRRPWTLARRAAATSPRTGGLPLSPGTGPHRGRRRCPSGTRRVRLPGARPEFDPARAPRADTWCPTTAPRLWSPRRCTVAVPLKAFAVTGTGGTRAGPTDDVRLLFHLSLHGLHDRLVSLDIPGRDRPLPLRRAVGLSDDQEPSFADQKRTYADRDGKGRDVRQHAS